MILGILFSLFFNSLLLETFGSFSSSLDTLFLSKPPLLKENDTLDGIYQALDKIQQNTDKKYKGFIKGSVIEKLRNDKHNAFLSRDLAKINTEVPLILSNGYELKNINQ